MKIKLSSKERAEVLKAWKTGELDTSKIERLKTLDNKMKPMSIEEAKRIINEL